MAEITKLRWHRLLGLVLKDYFRDTAWDVEIERDLSHQQQLLDLLILRRLAGPAPALWPDGLDSAADHFLLTFKSLREPLTIWAIQESIGHYVSYRKLVSPTTDDLLPESAFRLVAASMRLPRDLARQIPLHPRSAGAYDLDGAATPVRVLVLSEMPVSAANVVWNLFSGQPELVEAGQANIQPRLGRLTTELNRLWAFYKLEGVAMPYTKEDLKREVKKELLAELTPEEKQQLLADLTPEQRLAGLTREQIQAMLRKYLDEGRIGKGT